MKITLKNKHKEILKDEKEEKKKHTSSGPQDPGNNVGMRFLCFCFASYNSDL